MALLTNVIEYENGVQYSAHTDCFAGRENDRIFTLLVYLDSLEGEGNGGTEFPLLNLTSPAIKGRVVLWKNLISNGDKHLPKQRRNGACDLRTTHLAQGITLITHDS